MKRSLPLLFGTLLAGAGVLALVFGSDRSGAIYSVSVSQLLARGLWDRRVRVQGTLVHQTLCRVGSECGYRFRMADYPPWNADGAVPRALEQLSVSYDGCLLPDTLREVPGLDTQIVVEGERCRTCHDFKASLIVMRSGGRKYEIAAFASVDAAAPRPMPRCSSLVPSM